MIKNELNRKEFLPSIIVFLYRCCLYAGLDLGGLDHLQYPFANVFKKYRENIKYPSSNSVNDKVFS